MEAIIKRENSNTYTDGLLATLIAKGHGFWNNFQYSMEMPTTEFHCLDEKGLTKMAMAVSEHSLREDWENEDDRHWQSFLKQD